MEVPALTSRIDKTDDQFQRNRQAYDAMVEGLQAELATARRGGPQASRDRHVARGKLLPRDRIGTLIHQGAPFL
jgi:3-methylcrotonyl-CoA carboxylase beta subunit